jgi:all-trans-retinol dehydrogenase (NAD+)
MQFSIGHIFELLDWTVLNPWLSGVIAIASHVLTTYQHHPAAILPYSLLQTRLDDIGRTSTKLFVVGAVLRVNRWMSRRALNNGVKARFDWPKEIIVVTGGAGGIGAKTVQRLAARGSKVVVLDVLPLTFPKCKLPSTCPITQWNELLYCGLVSNVHYYQCDLTDYDAVMKVAAKVAKEVGQPTCVVANAGLCRGKTILEAEKRDIEL